MTWTRVLVVCLAFTWNSPNTHAQLSDDWIVKRENLNDSFTFNCTTDKWPKNAPANGSGYEYDGWMFPNLTLVSKNYSDGRRHVLLGGFQLRVDRMLKEDLGVYHCVLRTTENQDMVLVKWGLNMKGPYFVSLWDKYRRSTIIGCSAGGGFAVLCLILFSIYQLRYVPPKYQDAAPTGTKGLPADGLINGGYRSPTLDETDPGLGADNTAVAPGYMEVMADPDRVYVSTLQSPPLQDQPNGNVYELLYTASTQL